jgi:hypothetical protein
MEANALLAPFIELGGNIFGYQHRMSGPANQFVFLGIALGSNQRENCVAIRRCHGNPAACGFIALIHHEPESQLVDIKSQAPILVADKNIDAEEAKVRIPPIQTKARRRC